MAEWKPIFRIKRRGEWIDPKTYQILLHTDYPDLHGQYGWRLGVHQAPRHYEHPWLAVTDDETHGTWTREEAREIMRQWRRNQRLLKNL